MAVLNKEFNKFDKDIKLTPSRKKDLKKSRKDLKKKIRKWFKDNKPDEIQPKFHGQGSFEMNTTINPIVLYDAEGNTVSKYDLDYGVYFIKTNDDDTKQSINTWHDWVFKATEDHTNQDSIKKTTCVRVVFADGHHVDLPIYYKEDDTISLAHKSKDWIENDPKAFYEWFNTKKKDLSRLEAVVRCLKAWKNYREDNNKSLKLPSGFELTILATNHYVVADNLDEAYRKTVQAIDTALNKENGFKCYRPTTPSDENVFEDYSKTRKENFLSTLRSLKEDCEKAVEEKNFKKASEILIKNQFGNRFPLGEDKDESSKNDDLKRALQTAIIKPKPYASN